jgi:molecular chaperone Hsp33
MSNTLQSFVLEGHGIRGAIVRLRETWRNVIAQHDYPDSVIELLGEAVAATLLLGNGLKDQPQVSLQLQGEGAVRLLVIQCSGDLRVRGMAQWSDDRRAGPLLAGGRLAVNVDTGKKNGFFQGIVPLVSRELPECLEAYFAQSEQLPTRIWLFGERDAAGGFMLQTLPGQKHADDTFETVSRLARGVSLSELEDTAPEELLPRLFDGFEIRLFKPRAVSHDCRCTPEHLARIARMLGSDELHEILAEQGHVGLTCEFCNRAFHYSAEDVAAVLRGESPDPGLAH